MNKQDELWEQQDKLIGDIDFILRAFQEETPIYNVVTDNYPAIDVNGGIKMLFYGGLKMLFFGGNKCLLLADRFFI